MATELPFDVLCEICRHCDISTAVALGKAHGRIWKAVTEHYGWIKEYDACCAIRKIAVTLPMKRHVDVDICQRERLLRGCKRHFFVDRVFTNWDIWGVTVVCRSESQVTNGLRWLFCQRWLERFVHVELMQVIFRLTRPVIDDIVSNEVWDRTCIKMGECVIPVIALDSTRRDAYMNLEALHAAIKGTWVSLTRV